MRENNIISRWVRVCLYSIFFFCCLFVSEAPRRLAENMQRVWWKNLPSIRITNSGQFFALHRRWRQTTAQQQKNEIYVWKLNKNRTHIFFVVGLIRFSSHQLCKRIYGIVCMQSHVRAEEKTKFRDRYIFVLHLKTSGRHWNVSTNVRCAPQSAITPHIYVHMWMRQSRDRFRFAFFSNEIEIEKSIRFCFPSNRNDIASLQPQLS